MKTPINLEPTSTRFIFLQAALELIGNHGNQGGTGVLTTTGPNGSSYSCESDTFYSPALRRIVSFSHGNSRETKNIRINASIDWMFTRWDKRELAQAKGHAEIVDNPEELKRLSDELGLSLGDAEKEKSPTPINLVAIKTYVTEINYSIPDDKLFVSFNLNSVLSFFERLKDLKEGQVDQLAS